jgi:cell division protein FtsQ
LSESSDRSNPHHTDVDPEGPRGLFRRGPDEGGPARLWPILVLTAMLVGIAGWWVTNSPVFQARHVEVSGAEHLSRAKVLRLAHVGRGTNLFWFHAGTIERRLEASPWVARATVARSLPSTLSIEVKERRPVAQMRADAGFLTIASDGTILGSTAKRRSFPLLTFDVTKTARDHVSRPAWVVGAMTPWLRSRVSSVLQTSDGSVVVHLASGVPVYYGDATQVLSKDRALAAVVRWAITGRHPLESINVRAPLAPTARLQVYVPPPTLAGVTAAVHVSGTGSASTTSASPSPSPSPARSPSPPPVKIAPKVKQGTRAKTGR